MKNKAFKAFNAFNVFILSIGLVIGCVLVATVRGIPTTGGDNPSVGLRVGVVVFIIALVAMIVSAVTVVTRRKRQ
jgi:uncharacterized membrane protein YhaH (DUF805 family)